jgi:hypothetical protein
MLRLVYFSIFLALFFPFFLTIVPGNKRRPDTVAGMLPLVYFCCPTMIFMKLRPDTDAGMLRLVSTPIHSHGSARRTLFFFRD